MKLGYFTGDMKYFREGEEIMAIREALEAKNEEIEKLEGELRKSKSE